MAENTLERIRLIIDTCWANSEAWPEFVQTMRQTLLPKPSRKLDSRRDSSRWALLPGLCCQAAGGDPLWADEAAAAWLLFYLAAHLMDHVEDRDMPDPCWAEIGPGAALNAASGLFFSASLILNQYHGRDETRAAAPLIVQDFHTSFLSMGSGQHADLTGPQPGLEKYWQIAQVKSGAFFALACAAGARLGGADPDRLSAYRHFGRCLGTLIQALDDLEEFKPSQNCDLPAPKAGIGRSLPVVYALEVYPQPARDRLRDCLQAAPSNPIAAREALQLVEQSGASLYMLAEIERLRQKALAALEAADPLLAAKDRLVSLLHSLDPQ